jgi:phenylalanyl-tRNA synthetase alpha chain
MENHLETLQVSAKSALEHLVTPEQLEEWRVKVFGRKGELTQVLAQIKDLPSDQRPQAGQLANQVKNNLLEAFEEKRRSIAHEGMRRAETLVFDPTLPGRPIPQGKIHILNQTITEISSIFQTMGFDVAEGPEIETEYYNFEAMNFPKDHPARDMHDTFFLDNGFLLRTHTSPVQIRYMESHRPPLRAIMPGKTYRCDDDATHSPMFHQVEGLMIDEGISFAHLKGVLALFIERFFGPGFRVRFRPSFFPFTEPSAEVDISCVACQSQGCLLCKHSGWMEILGAGMVHPNVLRAGGVDFEKYSGFAFGMGVERMTMLKHGIDNLKYFYENDFRFLNQF